MPEVTINLPELPVEYEYTGEFRIPLKNEYLLVNHLTGTLIQKQGDRYGEGYVYSSPYLIVRKRFDFPPVAVKISDIYSTKILEKLPVNMRIVDFRTPNRGEWYFTYYGEAVRFSSTCPPYPHIILDLVGYKKEDCK